MANIYFLHISVGISEVIMIQQILDTRKMSYMVVCRSQKSLFLKCFSLELFFHCKNIFIPFNVQEIVKETSFTASICKYSSAD